MKQLFIVLAFVGLHSSVLNAQAVANSNEGLGIQQNTTVSFKENKGQIGDQNNQPRPDVLFSGTDGDLVYHLKNNGISYQLSRVDAWKDAIEAPQPEELREVKQVPAQTTVYRVDVNWLNINSSAQVVKGQPQPGVENYYTPVCPNGVSEVKTYSDITYRNLYNGIDLKWYAKDNHLEYDYLVSAGADYRQIQLQFDGATSLHIDANGNLVIETPLGNFTQQAPMVIQEGTTLPSRWILKNDLVTFHIENIDPAKAFIIDPLVRAWGTYYGGTGVEEQYGCTADALGNVYATGYTTSTASIATAGAHQTVYGGGPGGWDAYLVKFNAAGVRQWCTYYGGADIDQGFSCAVDGGNNVFLAGLTVSLSGIASPGSYQTVYGGGTGDAFLVKFNSNGVRQWSTYYGGSSVEQAQSCAIDPSGNIFISGYATSTTAIASVGSHQPALGGGYDAFLAKFAPNGVRMWGTYYGGTGSESFGYAATDLSGNVYLSGNTPSATGIATAGSHQPASGGGSTDGYLAKFNASGVRQWATYYGGTSTDAFRGCKTDAGGNVYVSGFTQSANGIATPGAHQTVPGGSYDPMLVKFDPSGVRQWGTYYGGGTFEQGYSCAVNPLGEVYMTGYTSSTTGIANAPAYQATPGGNDDAFLVKFDANGVVRWGTYYGGESSDQGYSCAVDQSGRVYLSGTTGSTLAMASPGAYQTVRSTPTDGYLVKFCDVSVALVSQTNILCFGANSGTAQVTASGSDSFTYNWMPGNPTGDGTTSVSGLIAGTWTCVITNSCGSTDSVFVNIAEPSALVASAASQTNISCNGGSNGDASVTVSGGTTAYSYDWTPGNPTGDGTASVTGLVAGTWTCTVTDANSCTATQTFNITAPTAIVVTPAAQTNVSCFGGTNGAASINIPTGGAGGYTYNWTPGNPAGDGTVSVTGLTAGTWTCTATDANSCQATSTFNITSPPALFVGSSSQIDVSCFGGNTGLAYVSVSGGTAAYSYDWTPGNPTGDGTATVTGLTAGTWTCTVTDANSCVTTQTFNITSPPALVASAISQTNVSCFGGSNGAISVSIAGGTGPFIYDWSPGTPTGDGTTSVTGLAAGTWTFAVVDANSCVATQTFNITAPSALVASAASQTNISCNGGSNGAASVSVSGGTAAYSYNWTPGNPTGDGSASVTALTAGTWTCTVTDANSCVTTQTFNITAPSALAAAAATQTNISCNGGSNGAASVTVSGGTTAYSYDWTPGNPTGDGTASVTGLTTGTWTCTVTDANSCVTTQTFNITAPVALVATSTSGSILCNGGTTTVTVVGTGGTSPYTGAGTLTVTAGTYSYTVTDANGCTTTTSITVIEPTALAASSSATSIACNGGSATVTVAGSGGTAPYTGTGTFTVTAGTYSYTVTDANGCTNTTSITVTQPTALAASSSATSIACNGGSATVSVTGSGGTAPYTGTGTFTVSAGTYSYTVTDANGCANTTSITITEPTALAASSSATSIACNGGSATVTVTGSGGTAPYTGTGTFTVTAGSYSYTVTDANGCANTTSITITEPTALAASSSATSIACNGGSATITVAGSGGTVPYSGTGTFTVTAGTYSYTVTDANGCTTTTSITVTEPTALTASSSATSIACNGGSATVTVTGSGGTSPYTGEGSFTEIAGTYSYTVTDANGCTTTTSVTVTEPAALTANSSATSILCNGGNATVTVAGSGGTAPYTGEGSFTEFAGTYSYTVTDANGCAISTSITVTEPAILAAAITTAVNPGACGGTDGSIDITVSGGTPGYSYLWNTTATTEDLSTIGAGTYNCTVTDTNGCTAQTTAVLNDPNAPTVTLAIAPDTMCSLDGMITLTGGAPAGGGYSGPGVAFGTFDPALANIGLNVISYSYVDSAGCSGSALDSIYVDVCTGTASTVQGIQFTVYPNPNDGTFTILTTSVADVNIFDAQGKLVLALKVQPDVQTQMSIVESGMYMVTVIDSNGVRTSERVIVTK